MPVGAIVGAATVGGAAISANAAKKQSQAAQNTANSNNALQQQIFEQQRADLAPWRDAGGVALEEIRKRLGLSASPTGTTPPTLSAADMQLFGADPLLSKSEGIGGKPIGNKPTNVLAATTGTSQVQTGQVGQPQQQSALDPNQSGFTTSPGYQFRLNEGLNAITGNRAAGGMLQSGDTLRALNAYGQDYASNEFNTQLQQLFQLSGLGQNATNSGNVLASNYGAQVGANNQYASNALQSSYGTQANAWGNALGSLGGYGMYRWG